MWQRYIIKIQIQFRNKSKENLLKINHLTIKIMIKDYQEIKDVIMLYTNGCATGDVELTKKAFHKDAIMYGYLNGELSAGSIENLYAAIRTLGAAPDTKVQVDILECIGTAATVRVVLENWHGLSFTDFHSLLKIEGKWTIVSKVFHQ